MSVVSALVLTAAAFHLPHALLRSRPLVGVRLCETPDETPDPVPENQLRSKLAGEAEALSISWRTARQVVYAGFGLAGVIGLTGSVPDILSGEAVDGSAVGVAVDAAVLFCAIAGAVVDTQAGAKPAKPAGDGVPRPVLPDWGDSGDLRVQLRLSDREIKPVSLTEAVKGAKQTMVLLGGDDSWLRESLIGARFDAELFRNSDVLLVPISLDSSGGVAAPASGKSAPEEAFAKMMAAEDAEGAGASKDTKASAGSPVKKGFCKGIASSSWTAVTRTRPSMVSLVSV